MVKYLKVFVLAAFAMMATQAMAQGKIAVVDIQRAILETDAAKTRLDGLRQDASYVENKKELEKWKSWCNFTNLYFCNFEVFVLVQASVLMSGKASSLVYFGQNFYLGSKQ